MDTTTPPTCFLSYSWDDPGHADWVRQLADDLMEHGVYTYLDQWDLEPGADIARFMENVTRSTWIGVVCTPAYARKSEERAGGVGFEAQLIVRQILSGGDDRAGRVIPLLRRGAAMESIPPYLGSPLYVDFRSDADYGTALETLLRRIFDKPAHARPALGPTPAFVPDAGPSRWILVAGSGRQDRLAGVVEETSKLLGNMLAQNGFALVSGGWQGVDRVVARSFAMALYSHTRPLEECLVQVIRRDRLPVFPGGNLIFVAPGDEEYDRAIQRADAVVLVEGFGGTLETGRRARRLGKPALPLADTGGDARTLYWEMLRDADRRGDRTIERLPREEFMKLSRPAPQVVSVLADVLRCALAESPA